MQDQKQFEAYLKSHSWSKADAWLETELCLMRSKLKFQRVVHHTFGILMSIVVAFFTWVILFPSADEKELKAFPLATICNNLFQMLCQRVPGGKPAVIIGLVLIPFLVGAILALALYWIKPKATVCGKTRASVHDVNKKLGELCAVYGKYHEIYGVLLYFLFAGFLSGGIMVLTSVYGGLNPFEYLFVGIILDVAYFVIFFGASFVFTSFRDKWGVSYYHIYDWRREVEAVIDKSKEKQSSNSYIPSPRTDNPYYQKKFNEYYAQYMGLDYETDEEKAKRIAIEIEDDLTGNYGDY